ncbi:MAG: mechanosensitive ion channel family protein, partial [Planctomycetota bacterium]
FGAITIFFDQPYKVGERIVFGGYDGVVEDIGFRSTRVRTLTGHLVTVPNSKIANESVENIGRRPYIRRLEWIRLPFDTPWAQVEEAVQVIRDVLAEPELAEPINPTIGADSFPPRVNFFGFHEHGYQIIMLYWFAPPAYWDYLAHGEKVNLRIVEEYQDRGIRFAMPPRAVYHHQGDAPDDSAEPDPPPPA